MLEQQRVIESVRDEVWELTRTSGMEAECFGFAMTEDAFLAILKKKTNLLNIA